MIFNPASGRGRGARRIATYRRLLEEAIPHVSFGVTERPGQEAELAERALDQGFHVIAAAGGDGTWSNVADRVVASGRADVAFGLLPNGTGNDFGRSLGFRPDGAEDAVRVLAAGHTRSVDVGRLDTPSASEHTPQRLEARHFLNLIGFGFDIAVIDAAARARFLKGELLYKITALQQLFRFPGFDVSLTGSSGWSRTGHHLMVTVSNGRFFGGGFPIAPQAGLSDGLLHACAIGDGPPLTRLRLFNLAEKGRHVNSDRVEVQPERRFTLTFDAPPRFEMDGDVRRAGHRTLEARLLPGALRVVAPAPEEHPGTL
ncbi:MAG: diacylglycerol/lipid kinase family protein [Gemmatimonadota bacterium]